MATVIENDRRKRVARLVFGVVGVCIVLYGMVDILVRLSHRLGPDATLTAFGPAIVALNAAHPFASTATALVPARLMIPAIGVSASVESVGQKADGSMATPSSFATVAWYKLGSEAGESGNAVIAGHVNNALTKTGVFEHLSDLQLGDMIVLTDAQGRSLRFAVSDIEDYPSDAAPLSTIFSTTGPSQVVLITCAGDWDPKARSFDHRLVVYGRLLAQ